MIFFAYLAVPIFIYGIIKQVQNFIQKRDNNGLDKIRISFIVGYVLLLAWTVCRIMEWFDATPVFAFLVAVNGAIFFLQGDLRDILKLPLNLIKRIWRYLRTK